jgi:hypothetical protein
MDLSLYPKEDVAKAFWLQEKIYREGLVPVGFMKVARQYAETEAVKTYAKHIRQELR